MTRFNPQPLNLQSLIRLIATIAILIPALGAAVTVPCRASNVAITNPSFESNVLSTGAYTTDSITGWTGSGSGYGAYHPLATDFPYHCPYNAAGIVPDGVNEAYVSNGASISQTLSSTLASGNRYDLTVKVGQAASILNCPQFTLQLLAGSTVIAQQSYGGTGLPGCPGPGGWWAAKLSYVAQSNDPALGSALKIVLTSNTSGVAAEIEYDDVRLTKTAVSATAPNAGNPVIQNLSETAAPGQTIDVQGQNFGTAPQVWIHVVTGSEPSLTPDTRLTVLTSTGNDAIARLPTSVSLGLYAVWVKNGTAQSDPSFVNQARATGLEFEDIQPGETFRVWGRNLAPSGSSPTVTLINSQTGTSYAATVASSGNDNNILTATAPSSLTVGTPYLVYVRNGFGGSYGQTLVPPSFVARTAQADYFSLGVPWAADFNTTSYNVKTSTSLPQHAAGNNTTDDRAAVQSDINWISANGGGILYFPAGTYKIGYNSGSVLLTMASGVVLQGAGAGSTTLRYDVGRPGTGLAQPLFDFGTNAGMEMGIADMTLKPIAGANAPITGHFASKIFVQRVNYTGAITFALLGSVKDVAFENCAVEVDNQTTSYYAAYPVQAPGDMDVVFRNCTFKYAWARFQVPGTPHLLIEGCHLQRLYTTSPWTGSSGGIVLDHQSDVTIYNNTLDENAPSGSTIYQSNDGETVLSELGTFGTNDSTFGTATGGSATTLVDTGANQGAGFPIFTDTTPIPISTPPIVVILSGPGMGQWRAIVGNTASTLTVDHPWRIAPGSGSKYTIQQWATTQCLVKNNFCGGNPRGLWLYNNNQDWAIVGNSLYDNDGINILNVHHPYNSDGSTLGALACTWNVQVQNNSIVDISYLWPAYIVACTTYNGGGATGNSTHDAEINKAQGAQILGVDIRGNTVQAYALGSNCQSSFNGLIPEFSEGYCAYVDDGGGALPNSTTYGILGTLFDTNTAVNCDYAYVLGTGVQDTALYSSTLTNCGTLMRDDTGTGATHASVGTVTGP